jgi:hypothetical protein
VTTRVKQQVVTAWAEKCSGPGWTNRVVWVLLRSMAGELSIEAIQPTEQSDAIMTLFDIGAAASKALTREAAAVLKLETTER